MISENKALAERGRALGRRVAFYSLGCRVNYDEVDCLRGRFIQEGWTAVPFGQEADLFVINTCTVTQVADADSRKVIRRAVRAKSPGGLVVVTGCYAQRDPQALRDLEGVDLILGNSEKSRLFEHVRRYIGDHRLAGDLWVTDQPRTQEFLRREKNSRSQGPRTRATLKIQDGCNEACTYCIIPSVRGVSVSRAPSEVLREAKQLSAIGFKEIALTGVNTGSYGKDLLNEQDYHQEKHPQRVCDLASLIRALHALGLPLRYRLNSLEPPSITEDLLDAIEESPSFCRHFHVPLQHGDNRILRKMGRGYDANFYAHKIRLIQERFPGAGIGADVMIGFPGEEEEHFETMKALLLDLSPTYLHVFSYSVREGTPAGRMPAQVPAQIKKRRARTMHDVEDQLRARYIRDQQNQSFEVLVEDKKGPNGGWTGLTDRFLRVELNPTSPSSGIRENSFVRATICGSHSPKLAIAEVR
jgi:threonylcarbamoyladenosine tRNA methylthiotransferase MtaB